MYVAVSTGSEVLEVAVNEASSLVGMIAYAKMGYKNLSRIITTEDVFVRYSDGENLKLDIRQGKNGKNIELFVA